MKESHINGCQSGLLKSLLKTMKISNVRNSLNSRKQQKKMRRGSFQLGLKHCDSLHIISQSDQSYRGRDDFDFIFNEDSEVCTDEGILCIEDYSEFSNNSITKSCLKNRGTGNAILPRQNI